MEDLLDAIREVLAMLGGSHVAVGILELDAAELDQVHLPGAVGCEECNAESDDALEVVAHTPLAEVEDEVYRDARELGFSALEVTERHDGNQVGQDEACVRVRHDGVEVNARAHCKTAPNLQMYVNAFGGPNVFKCI
eukprot:2270368-Rhodomonas_salina.1